MFRFAFQLALSKVGILHKPCFMDLQSGDSYANILARTDENARRLQMIGYGIGLAVAAILAAAKRHWAWAAASALLPFAIVKLTYKKSPLSAPAH